MNGPQINLKVFQKVPLRKIVKNVIEKAKLIFTASPHTHSKGYFLENDAERIFRKCSRGKHAYAFEKRALALRFFI